MKIVRILPEFNKNISGGLAPNAYYISKFQVKNGHNVWIFSFTNNKPKIINIEGVKVIWIKKPHFIRIFGGYYVFKALKKYNIKPNIIHGLNAIPFGWLFPFWKNKIKTKYVLSIHTSTKPLQKKYIKGIKNKINSFEFSKLIFFLAKRVDLILPISKYIKKELTDSRIPNKKINVIPVGISYKTFYNPHWKVKASNDLLKNNKIVLLNVGRFSQLKGLTYLIKAVDLLKNQYKCKLILIGGKNTDDDYENIIKTISKLNLSRYIEIKKPIPYEELRNIYLSSDLFILSSVYEPKGKVILEAQSAGIPVIATKAGGVSELIKSNYNGLLINPKNENEIYNAVMKLIKNNRLRKHIITNSITTSQKFDWKFVSKSYTDNFKLII